MTPAAIPATIMIIDDEPENLNVLGEMLRQEGWDVRAFPRGDMALAAAADEKPDLVLLDNVRFFRSVGNTAVVLASNDNALCAEARRLGAHVISALDLGSLLG